MELIIEFLAEHWSVFEAFCLEREEDPNEIYEVLLQLN